MLFEPNDRLAHRVSAQWQRGQGPNGETLADLNLPEIRYSGSYSLNRLAFRWLIAHRLSRKSTGPDELPVTEATKFQLGVSYLRGDWRFDLSANKTNTYERLGVRQRTGAEQDVVRLKDTMQRLANVVMGAGSKL